MDNGDERMTNDDSGLCMGVSIVRGGIQNGWFMSWKIPMKIRMMTGGTPMTQETTILYQEIGCPAHSSFCLSISLKVYRRVCWAMLGGNLIKCSMHARCCVVNFNMHPSY